MEEDKLYVAKLIYYSAGRVENEFFGLYDRKGVGDDELETIRDLAKSILKDSHRFAEKFNRNLEYENFPTIRTVVDYDQEEGKRLFRTWLIKPLEGSELELLAMELSNPENESNTSS